MALKEYRPGTAFPGVVGRTIGESEPAWPQPKRSRRGAPNVVFIVLDDLGFAQLGCYGGLIRTPNLDRLAAGGVRFNNMHTTALCSPTRSCILTGRNHHSNAMACITEGASGYPGANGQIPFENGFLSEILLLHGYNTYAIGKWHLTPADQLSIAGPFDRWPLGRGFERYYGFLGADTSQYYPELVYDNHQVDPPRTPEQGYHLTEDLADRAIEFIRDAKQLAPDKPFFLYFCTGTAHAPHHVPIEWADRYKGVFDDGWDAAREQILKRQLELGIVPAGTRLSRHDPDVQEWDSLSPPERRLYARMMEICAGFIEHADHHIGRLIRHLEDTGQLEDTLIMAMSDNGASAEGGPHGSVNENRFFNNVPDSLEDNLAALPELGGPKYYNHYPWGWAFAGDTPLRRWKRETYRGGIADPLIVHWPRGFDAKGEIRSQYLHAIDLVPTVLECLELEPPAQIRGVTQSPIQGVSFKAALHDANAKGLHHTQYFEMFGHRSVYHDGWTAVCPLPGPSFREAGMNFGEMMLTEDKLRDLDAHGWELYHVEEDFSENTNLADAHRDKLLEMIALWYVEAGKYDVFPLDPRGIWRLTDERPRLTPDRTHYEYYPNTSGVPQMVAARVLNRPHAITATVEIPEGGAEGVLLAQGGNTGGYSLFLQGGKLHYVHNYVGVRELHVESTDAVPPGRVSLRFEFKPTGDPDFMTGRGSPGRAQLYIDGKLVGQDTLDVTTPIALGLGDVLSTGRDTGSSVSTRYQPPFEFTGHLFKVEVDVDGPLLHDGEAEARQSLARE